MEERSTVRTKREDSTLESISSFPPLITSILLVFHSFLGRDVRREGEGGGGEGLGEDRERERASLIPQRREEGEA